MTKEEIVSKFKDKVHTKMNFDPDGNLIDNRDLRAVKSIAIQCGLIKPQVVREGMNTYINGKQIPPANNVYPEKDVEGIYEFCLDMRDLSFLRSMIDEIRDFKHPKEKSKLRQMMYDILHSIK